MSRSHDGAAPCPRCGHLPGPADPVTHPGICPACGIAREKWRARQGDSAATETGEEESASVEAALLPRLIDQLLLPPEGMDPAGRLARAMLLALLAIWTAWFALQGIDWESIGGSLLHQANLPFHEFGHLFFSAFGDTLMILGGSLFQLLLPLSIAVYFAVWQQDNIAASVACWWTGQNFVDLSPYIRDAEYRVLPLVGGRGEESHDWGNLLTQWGSLDQCYVIARWSFGVGLLVMLLSLAWGAAVLWKSSQED